MKVGEGSAADHGCVPLERPEPEGMKMGIPGIPRGE